MSSHTGINSAQSAKGTAGEHGQSYQDLWRAMAESNAKGGITGMAGLDKAESGNGESFNRPKAVCHCH